jgi:HK97 family phage major capsid protein
MQTLRQAAGTPEFDAVNGRHLSAAVNELIQDAALNADGTNDSPTGVRYTAGIGSVVGGTNGAQLSFAHLADLEDACDANVEESRTGFVVNAPSRRWLRTQPQGTGLAYCWTGGEKPLLGHAAITSNVMPSNVTKGTSNGICSAIIYSADWSHLVVGLYGGGLDIVVDRHTLASSGQIRIVVSAICGVGVTMPSAIAAMSDALTT